MKSNKKGKEAGPTRERVDQFQQMTDATGELSARVDELETCDDSSDLDEQNCTDEDDSRWEVFLFDDDSDPLPEYGDFWLPD